MKRVTQIMFSTVLVLAIFACTTIKDYSQGFRVGVVNKFSFKGTSYKTWEGELTLGGVRLHSDDEGNTSATANIWAFSIDGARMRGEDTAALVRDITRAAESGEAVKITYVQDLYSDFSRGRTDYFVQKVEFLKGQDKR